MEIKTKFAKILVLILAAVFSVTAFAGCGDLRGNNVDEEPVDTTKTQLYVGYYYAGLGKDWIQEVADRFEEEYADYSFQTGKTGVQVRLDLDKAGLNGGDLLNTIGSKRDQIFFVENADMYAFINGGHIREITGLVKSPAAEGESATIESKLTDNSKAYYNVGGKYYALPYYEAFVGMNYNIDLFESKLYYFAKGKSAEGFDFENGNLNDLFVTSADADRSAGPDGIEGTTDDGLPATYADFRALLMRIKQYGDIPMIWCGNYLTYLIEFMNGVWADYEGYDQMALNWSMNGDATSLVDVSESGEITPYNGGEPVTITNGDQGYMLQKQEGKYHALEFAKICVGDSNNYYENSFSSSTTHIDAQRRFVKGGTGNYPNIAILIDGNWWDVEATAQFDADPHGKNGKLTRNFGLMPMPKVDADHIGEPRTLLTLNNSMTFINASTEEDMIPCAEAFMRFVHSDEALNIFSRHCNMMRPFNYTISEDMLANMSAYGKEMYRIHQQVEEEKDEDEPAVRIQDSFPTTTAAIANTELLNPKTWGWTNDDGNVNPFVTFKENPNMTAAQYFNSMLPHYQRAWGSMWKNV